MNFKRSSQTQPKTTKLQAYLKRHSSVLSQPYPNYKATVFFSTDSQFQKRSSQNYKATSILKTGCSQTDRIQPKLQSYSSFFYRCSISKDSPKPNPKPQSYKHFEDRVVTDRPNPTKATKLQVIFKQIVNFKRSSQTQPKTTNLQAF